MKQRYVIGFFIFIIALLTILDIGYYASYQIYKQNTTAKVEEKTADEPNLPADGSATKNVGYYLAEQNGYIIVYLSDKETVYQYTTIQLTDLPMQTQNEIRQTKHVPSTQELYAFLENYSS